MVFDPQMSTVSLLYPLHTTLIIREHSYLFNPSSPFYQCLISRNFTIFCWGLTPCSIAKNWMYGSPWTNTLIGINIRIASSQLQYDHGFLKCCKLRVASQMVSHDPHLVSLFFVGKKTRRLEMVDIMGNQMNQHLS